MSPVELASFNSLVTLAGSYKSHAPNCSENHALQQGSAAIHEGRVSKPCCRGPPGQGADLGGKMAFKMREINCKLLCIEAHVLSQREHAELHRFANLEWLSIRHALQQRMAMP